MSNDSGRMVVGALGKELVGEFSLQFALQLFWEMKAAEDWLTED